MRKIVLGISFMFIFLSAFLGYSLLNASTPLYIDNSVVGNKTKELVIQYNGTDKLYYKLADTTCDATVPADAEWLNDTSNNKLDAENKKTFSYTSYDNEKVICLYTHDGVNDPYSESYTVDTKAPEITVTEAIKTPAKEKEISAEITEGTLSFAELSGVSETCDGSLTFTDGTSKKFTSEDDNGKALCFKAVDEIGNESFKKSEAVSGIDTTAPEITVIEAIKTPAKEKEISAAAGTDTLVGHKILNSETETCNDTLAETEFTAGNPAKFISESDNDKVVCFRAKDEAGNISTKKSEKLEKIDTTAPVIELNDLSDKREKSKTISIKNLTDNLSIEEKMTVSHEVIEGTCDTNVNFTKTGKEITLTDEADNGKKVCFKVVDEAGNEAFAEKTIENIDTTAPVITITEAIKTPAKEKEILATAGTDILVGHKILNSETETCDDTLAETEFTAGNPAKFTSELDNDKVVCFRAKDEAGNISTKKSEKLEKIDTTAPVIELNDLSEKREQSKTISIKNLTDNLSIEEKMTVSHEVIEGTCDTNVNFTKTGKEITLTDEADNGKKVCFKVVDEAGNEAFAEKTIENIDTTKPEVKLNELSEKREQSKTISVESVEDLPEVKVTDLEKFSISYKILEKDGVCDNEENLTEGKTVTLSEETENGKKVCFVVKDEAGNTTFTEKTIEKIDKTAPVINISEVLVANSLTEGEENYFSKNAENNGKITLKLGNYVTLDSFKAKIKDVFNNLNETEETEEEKFGSFEKFIDEAIAVNPNLVAENGIFTIKEIGDYTFIFDGKDEAENSATQVTLTLTVEENKKTSLAEQIKDADFKLTLGSVVRDENRLNLEKYLPEAKAIFENKNSTKKEIDEATLKLKDLIKKLNYAYAPDPKSLKLNNDSRVFTEVETKEEPKKEEPKKEEVKTEEIKEEVKNENTEIKTVIVKNEERKYSKNKKYNSCPMISNIVGDYNSDFSINFSDLENSHNLDEIQRLTKTTILNEKGVNNTGLFEPNRGITRAEFLAIILKAHCYDISKRPASLPYSDVDLDSWQAKVIKVGTEIGIVKGYNNGLFQPNKNISKIEAFAIMMKMADIKILENFKDSYTDKKASWQAGVLASGEYLGILKPENTQNKFYPDSNLTRNEMVKLIVDIIRLY